MEKDAMAFGTIHLICSWETLQLHILIGEIRKEEAREACSELQPCLGTEGHCSVAAPSQHLPREHQHCQLNREKRKKERELHLF